MSPVSILVATEADIPEMQRIRMSVRENRLSDPTKVQSHDVRAMILKRGRGWTARVEGRVVGFAVADRTGANVWALFVEPGAEGRGVGRRLHDTMMDWLFSTGVEHVWLGTDPGTRAEGFYRAARWRFTGFQPNGEARYEMSRAQWYADAPSPRA